MKRLWVIIVVVVIALLPSLHAFSAPGANWAIARTAYPVRVQLHTFPPTNQSADHVFGRFHDHSYAILGRQNGVGVVREAIHVMWWKHRRIAMVWASVASVYPTMARARAAIADVGLPIRERADTNLASGSRVIRHGSILGILSVALRGSSTVEQFSSVNPSVGRAVAVLQHYDWLQRTALTNALVQMVPPTMAPTDVPTRTPEPTATDVPTATPTLVPTATEVPATATDTPTDTPTATATPAPTPTPMATATPFPTAAPYVYPTSTPAPVYSPPPSSGCIPTEGDRDNDDEGKPAASWDHDGCP